MAEILAIYPGSFDPITNGHLDLIERGSQLFDRLIVAVLTNLEKNPLFTVPERVDMLQEATHSIPNVSVDTFSGLLVDYARAKHAKALLRGIRAFTDYEYELQMALMNRKLEPEPGNGLLDARPRLYLRQFAPGTGGLSPRGLRRRNGSAIGGREAAAESRAEVRS